MEKEESEKNTPAVVKTMTDIELIMGFINVAGKEK